MHGTVNENRYVHKDDEKMSRLISEFEAENAGYDDCDPYTEIARGDGAVKMLEYVIKKYDLSKKIRKDGGIKKIANEVFSSKKFSFSEISRHTMICLFNHRDG